MEKSNDAPVITVVVCIAIFLTACIASVSAYNLNQQNNMAKNIESAIAKGVDPISIKCTYDQVSTATCIAYALKGNK